MKWIEINAIISGEDEEIVSSIFYDAGAKGLDIEDPNDLIDLSNRKEGWDFFGINIENLNLDKVKIKSYFSQEEDVDSKLSFLREAIEGKGLGIISTEEIQDEDYLNNWKKYFKTFKIGENIVIKPSWEDYKEKEGEMIIDIDPGMAFGTGTHETTSLCIEALEKYLEEGDRVFDIGCGSGILSIASAKLGAKEITAIDLDPVCINVSEENILKNNLEDIIEVKKGNLLDVIEGKADLIVANIIAEAIITMTDSVREYLVDGGVFISSGIIVDKKDSVLQTLRNNGFKIEEINTQGEWVSIVSIKKIGDGMHRFFIDREVIEDENINIKGKDFNHIKNVLRMNEGEQIEISSNERLYIGEIKDLLEDSIIVNILEAKEYLEENVEIILFQGLAKGSKMDLIIQKGTEIGVKEFYAVSTHRTVVKIKDEKKEKNRLKRWNAIAEEAAKQSKRDYIPKVKDILTFKAMLELLKKEKTIIIPYEDEENISIGEVLKKINKKNINKINLIIGPEGGFEKEEIEAIKNLGGKIVTLGPKILRTETAGFVASTIILYELSEIGVI